MHGDETEEKDRDAWTPWMTPNLGPVEVPLEYHRILLDDPVRMDAYERAIRAQVKPGDVVLDLGAGTGILAMLAARQGALRVHAVECTAVAGLAARLVQANHLSDRVLIHEANALTLEPPERVDLVIGDFLGRFLIDDGMLAAVAATRRWCKPDTRFCPGLIRLMLSPVGDIFLRAVDLFASPLYGLDFTPAIATALNTCYHAELPPEALMAPAGEFGRYRPPEEAGAFDANLFFELNRPGRLQGMAGWFEAELAPGITLSTEPGIETHWGQYLFPVPPVEVRAGDRLGIHLWEERGPRDSEWAWDGEVTRAGQQVEVFSQRSVQWPAERGWPS